MKITDKHSQQNNSRELQHEHTMNQFKEMCKGTNCTASKAVPQHSKECKAEHDACYATTPEPEIPEGLEPVAWYDKKHGLPYGWAEESPTENAVLLILQSAALAALAKKEAEIADALDVRNGAGPTALSMVINERDQLREQVQRQTALIEKCRNALDLLMLKYDPANHQSFCECDPDVGYQCDVCKPHEYIILGRDALAAIDEHLKDGA